MVREWIFFDQKVIQDELDQLPAKDAAKMVALMEHFSLVGRGNPLPAAIDEYGEGIYRLRHFKSDYQGRALFFYFERTSAVERLVLLTVYKKESRSVPDSVLQRAKTRMNDYKRRNKSN